MVFPQKIEGIIFTEIIRELLPESNLKKLTELGAIVRQRNRTKIYEPLTDSLRKIQWVKLVGLKAIAIEKSISDAMEPHTLVMDPLGQTAHALCVTDCLIHTKSALDSMAVFLNDLLGLEQKGGDRDFKKPHFREALYEKDLFLKHNVKKLEHWFKELQNIRDEWIHRSSIRSRIIHGKSDVGILPIPKMVTRSFNDQRRFALTKENFWSTKDFADHYYSNLMTLFQVIIDRALQIERLSLSKPLIVPPDAEAQMTIFPTFVTENITVEKMKVNFRKSFFDW